MSMLPDTAPVPDDDSDYEPPSLLAHRIYTFDENHATRTSADPDWVQPSIVDIREFAGDDGEQDADFADRARRCHQNRKCSQINNLSHHFLKSLQRTIENVRLLFVGQVGGPDYSSKSLHPAHCSVGTISE